LDDGLILSLWNYQLLSFKHSFGLGAYSVGSCQDGAPREAATQRKAFKSMEHCADIDTLARFCHVA
jgi:hypothetical protein